MSVISPKDQYKHFTYDSMTNNHFWAYTWKQKLFRTFRHSWFPAFVWHSDIFLPNYCLADETSMFGKWGTFSECWVDCLIFLKLSCSVESISNIKVHQRACLHPRHTHRHAYRHSHAHSIPRLVPSLPSRHPAPAAREGRAQRGGQRHPGREPDGGIPIG